jgi:DNA topoisomerase VI subunit B
MAQPTVFTTDRLLEFTSVAELSKLIGYTPGLWPAVAIKELIDNALDAAEDANIAPTIAIRISTIDHTIMVSDNGPGIAADVIERLADFRTKTSSREAYVAPTRGAQGNAVQTVLAMPFALEGTSGRTIIEAHGIAHPITFTIDHVHRVPRIDITRQPSSVQNGTSITLQWPRSASAQLIAAKSQIVPIVRHFAFLNPHAAFCLTWDGTTMVKAKATNPSWRKWRASEPAPITWYDFESFNRRIAATIADDLKHGRDRTLREFIGEFRGCTRSAMRSKILDAVDGARMPLAEFFNNGHNPQRVDKLRLTMHALTKTVPAKDLGVLGKDHFESRFIDIGIMPESFFYQRVLVDGAGGFPYTLETGFAYLGSQARQQILGLNFSPRFSDPFTGLFYDDDDEDDEDIGTGLDAFLIHQRIGPTAPVVFALHLACPRLVFTDKGKTKLDLPTKVRNQLIDAVESVTRRWAKIVKAEERHASAEARREEKLSRRRTISIKDAAYDVMEWAYMAASDNDTLPANARQIMYAARGRVQERTGKQLNDQYFTQVLLPDYIAENSVNWDVVFDDRGHFREPHTGHIIGLGTLAVRAYLETLGAPELIGPQLKPAAIATRGPHGCFSAVMFVEKEGFDPLWQSVGLAERYDLAIMSTKGMSVTACRQLADTMCGQYNIPLLVLHDFDKSGFSIIGTLREATRRYTYTNEITVIDMGLRLADADGLQAEDVFDRGDEDARRINLHKNGATSEEIEFLLHRRVELNAMTSRQLVDFVERKLAEHGIDKVVPTKSELERAYRLFAHGRAVQEVIARELAKLNGSANIAVPTDLKERVAAYLKDYPATRWDDAVAAILNG